MPLKEPAKPVAFSPREFAALFGKEQSWGYRQLYQGRVRSVTEYGRIMIPASEVERILATASRYDGRERKKPARTKADFAARKDELQAAWRNITKRHSPASNRRQPAFTAPPATKAPGSRKAALDRLTKHHR